MKGSVGAFKICVHVCVCVRASFFAVSYLIAHARKQQMSYEVR